MYGLGLGSRILMTGVKQRTATGMPSRRRGLGWLFQIISNRPALELVISGRHAPDIVQRIPQVSRRRNVTSEVGRVWCPFLWWRQSVLAGSQCGVIPADRNISNCSSDILRFPVVGFAVFRGNRVKDGTDEHLGNVLSMIGIHRIKRCAGRERRQQCATIHLLPPPSLSASGALRSAQVGWFPCRVRS